MGRPMFAGPENRVPTGWGTSTRHARFRTRAFRNWRCSIMPANVCGEPNSEGSSVIISPLLANSESRRDRLMPFVQKCSGSETLGMM